MLLCEGSYMLMAQFCCLFVLLLPRFKGCGAAGTLSCDAVVPLKGCCDYYPNDVLLLLYHPLEMPLLLAFPHLHFWRGVGLLLLLCCLFLCLKDTLIHLGCSPLLYLS